MANGRAKSPPHQKITVFKSQSTDYHPPPPIILKFYTPYSNLLAHAAFFPCMGNHDFEDFQGGPWLDQFVLPQNGPKGCIPERHYWFDFGDVRFIALDTNERFEELKNNVAPWLEQVLAANDRRWTVLFFHHPVYTHGKYQTPGKLLQLIIPLCDRFKVDLVLSGHNHMYERSHPLHQGKIAPSGQGTTYLTIGTGGDHLYATTKPKPDFLAVQKTGDLGFTVVDVTPHQLTLRQLGLQNKLIDQFTLTKP